VPLVLFLPDVVPGKAVGWLAPLARRIAASTEEALQYLPVDKTVVTGYPVRSTFSAGRDPRARTRFQLPADGMVLLVVGGSQGARSINDAVAQLLPDLLSRYHVIHVCGEQRYEEARAAALGLPEDHQARYRLHPYLDGDGMAAAFGAADLALSRAGASVLGELPASGTPAVLVPFPAPGVHQRANAEYLARREAAVVVDDQDLTERLGMVLEELLSDPDRLREMARACQALARPEAAATIAALLAQEAA
jgi:UDP-N-acetylglucosamine--N-acetylmuramyl-(pentapeptide) pyrophosphoryl-undecaprenol N-acetylglucosamine transferase